MLVPLKTIPVVNVLVNVPFTVKVVPEIELVVPVAVTVVHVPGLYGYVNVMLVELLAVHNQNPLYNGLFAPLIL